jgi:hypothetical protein
MFNSRALLPSIEELEYARTENYKDTVKKIIIKRCGLINVNKDLQLEALLEEISFPLRLTAKKLRYTENLLMDLYKRPTRTSVWSAYTDLRTELEVDMNESFGLVFNVPNWSSTVIFHDYWKWGQTAFHGFGCWVRLSYYNLPRKFYVETLQNLLERINKDIEVA